MPPGILITAYSACNGLGQTTAEVLDGLFAGRRGLSPAEPWLGESTWVGAVPGELPALESSLRAFEGRQARIAQPLQFHLSPFLSWWPNALGDVAVKGKLWSCRSIVISTRSISMSMAYRWWQQSL